MKQNISIIEFITGILKDLPEFADLETWSVWFVVLKSIFGLPMDAAEFEIFKKLTGRSEKPEGDFRTVWVLAGRRSGKSFISAIILVYLAIFRRWEKGKHGVLMLLAMDKQQAQMVYKYCIDLLELPLLKTYVKRILAEEIEMKSGLTISIHVCSYRSLRGRRILAVVCDEITFWSRELSDPQEIIRALKPSLFENPDSLLLAISTVYARYGIAYDVYTEAFGKEEERRIVFRAGTADLNPTYSVEAIEDELAADPAGASAEYLSEFRSDRESYLSADVIESAVVPNRYELEPQKKISYVAFYDGSSGSRDSAVLAIAHKEASGLVVLDLVREQRPPFSPDVIIEEHSAVVKSFGLREITGDRYSGGWIVESFKKQNITYKNSELTKSDIYLSFIPLMMASRVELLDNDRMLRQLRQLERKTGGKKDSVDHPPGGGHDDLCNAASGACVLAVERKNKPYFGVSQGPMY